MQDEFDYSTLEKQFDEINDLEEVETYDLKFHSLRVGDAINNDTAKISKIYVCHGKCNCGAVLDQIFVQTDDQIDPGDLGDPQYHCTNQCVEDWWGL